MCFDPVSGQGIFSALHGGFAAGTAIAAALDGGSDALDDYSTRMADVWDIYHARGGAALSQRAALARLRFLDNSRARPAAEARNSHPAPVISVDPEVRLHGALKHVGPELYEALKANPTRARFGFGRKPALVNVDLQNAYTRPEEFVDRLRDRSAPDRLRERAGAAVPYAIAAR